MSIATYHHSYTHSHTDDGVCQPCKATASSSGTVRVKCLAQGHLDIQVGGSRNWTSNLSVTSQSSLPPELPPTSLSSSRRRLRWTLLSRPLSLYVFLYQYISLYTCPAPSLPMASIDLSLSLFIFFELSLFLRLVSVCLYGLCQSVSTACLCLSLRSIGCLISHTSLVGPTWVSTPPALLFSLI